MLTRRVLPALVAACSIACAGTPQTDPINARPKLNGDLVERVPTRARATTSVNLQGQPGSAAPPGAVVHVVDLDGTLAPVEATVEEDGSFEIALEMELGGALRLDVRSGDQRSDPVDRVVGADGLSPVSPSLACWDTSGAVLMLTEDGGVVSIKNDCDEPINVSRIALRVENPAFTLGVAPVEVPSGSTADVTVGYAPSASDSNEEILLIETDAPAQDRRAVTLVGVAHE